MKKATKLPNIVTILILTAITSLFWIIFGVYRVFTVKEEAKVPEAILAPLNPVLNQKVIDQMSQRFYLDEDQIPETVIVSPTLEPTIAPSPEPEESPIPSPEPSQTPGGEITE